MIVSRWFQNMEYTLCRRMVCDGFVTLDISGNILDIKLDISDAG